MDSENNEKPSILYLDSHLEFSQIFIRLLEGSGYKVCHYLHLEHLSTKRSPCDLILCELKLFAHHLFLPSTQNTSEPHKPCLVFSSHLSQKNKQMLVRQDVDSFFERGDNYKDILGKINFSLRR